MKRTDDAREKDRRELVRRALIHYRVWLQDMNPGRRAANGHFTDEFIDETIALFRDPEAP